nr:MAG TPA: hypothetical protein [Caudoviricetes sp.]
MNIIFAKHDNGNKEFVFEVPQGLNPTRGDILWVETMRGNAIAKATSGLIESPSNYEIAEKFGAYFPLKKVRAFANKEMQEYCESRILGDVLGNIADKLCKASKGTTDIPF